MTLSPYLLERQQRECFGTAKPEEKAKPKQIAKKSEKSKGTHKEYIKLVKEMMAESNLCEIKEQGCQVKASGLHHKAKRSPKNLLDRNNLLRACNNCQLWIENNPLESLEKGYSVSKHKLKI